MDKYNKLLQDFSELYETALLEQLKTVTQTVQLLQKENTRLKGGTGNHLFPNRMAVETRDFNSEDRIERLETITRVLSKELHALQVRTGNMRIDRQFRAAPKYFLNHFRKKPDDVIDAAPMKVITAPGKKTQMKADQPYDVIVFCPVYPGGVRPYGGEFIFKRVKAYVDAGLSVCVLEVNPKHTDEQDHTVGGIRVLRCNLVRADKFIQNNPPKYLGAHQVERPMWQILKKYKDRIPTTIWIHGFEARHWRELEDNYTKNELKKLQKTLDKVTDIRCETMKDILEQKNVRKIFVSNFMRSVTEKFTNRTGVNTHVIHNQILKADFPYRPKRAEQRFSVLWVRSFGSRNYSNDLSRDAIHALSKESFFKKMNFTIYGDGKLFEESTDSLRQYSNVKIHQKFITTEKLRELHSNHGLMLVPSRWDSQGLTCGEAMSSGLVPITTKIAALPEFVDDNCGMLCPPNDAKALAVAIKTCVESPKIFLKLSKAATKRSQRQCGYKNTVSKEISFFK